MATERGGLVGPRGKFARVDTRRQGIFPDTLAVVIDADSSDGDAEFELSQPDSHFCVTHVASGWIIGWDATQFSGDLTKQFYAIAPDRRGAYESPAGYELPSGLVILVVEYNDPRGYIASPLAWVKK
jgi:hypothetical protein